MGKKDILEKVMEKPELRQIPLEDIELAFEHFEKRQTSDEEKIRLTRELLHSVYGAFGSRKLFSPRILEKDTDWILKKHISTRERYPYYKEIYGRILGNAKKMNVIDLGAGINGLSYKFLKEAGYDARYLAVEGVGQLVELMNSYFKRKKTGTSAKAVHLSLFQLEQIKDLIKKQKGEKIIFLFKVLDSLEMLKGDYSKKLLLEITPLVEKIVVSLATKSMMKRKRFNVNRGWIRGFIEKNFKIMDDFELGGERYMVFASNN